MTLFKAATILLLTAATAQAAPLTTEAKDALLRALDDEYHAEQVYTATINKFGPQRPFSNIINAEVQHSSVLIALLQNYGVTVPENPYANGIKALEPIPDTLQAACTLGVTAEIENVLLYDQDLLPAVTQYPDITRVMTNLREASETKHLPAFQRCSQGGGFGKGQGKGRNG